MLKWATYMRSFFFLSVDYSRQKQTVNSSLINLWCAISSWSQCIMAQRWQTPLTTLRPSSSAIPPLSSALRRYDITGIGINLWLIHLHFIPGEPRHSRRNARASAHMSRNVHEHRQNLPSSPFLSYPEGPYSPFSLETVQIRSPAQLTLPSPAPSFHLLYRDSNSGLIEGFVRWGIASYPGTFCGPHNISHLLSYFSYSQLFFIKSRCY